MYEHRHFGGVIVALTIPAIGLLAWIGGSIEPPTSPAAWIVWGVLVLVVAALFLFSSLSVRVDDVEVSVWFGPGWPRTTIPLGEIEGAEPVTRSWVWGYGLRWTPKGWLWRASGVNAVQIARRDGRSTFVGTDDPEGLTAAIRERIAA